MYQLEECLQELGLKKNHINILKLLLSSKRPLKTKEASAAVKLPLNRTYIFLNELWEMGLIDKSTEGVLKFSIQNPELKLKNFIGSRYSRLKNIEKDILESVPKLQTRDAVVPIYSDEETYHAVYQMIQGADVIKAIAASPLLLVPEEQRNFWRHELFRAYREKISAGTEFWYMISGRTFRKVLKQKNKMTIERNLRWLARHENFHLMVIDMENTITAAITEKEAAVAFREPYAHNVVGGMLLRSPSMVGFLNTVYAELMKQGKEIKSFAQLMKVVG